MYAINFYLQENLQNLQLFKYHAILYAKQITEVLLDKIWYIIAFNL